MTNEEILQKAIEKAVKNGWVGESGEPRNPADLQVNIMRIYYRHIFSHDFAKALWGEDKITECPICKGGKDKSKDYQGTCDYCHGSKNEDRKLIEIGNEGWEYHLQQMVLEEEPLKYIEKYL